MVNDKLAMDFVNYAFDFEIKLVNAFGQTVISKKTTLNADTELDLSALENGIYFLHMFDKESVIVSKKIIKE